MAICERTVTNLLDRYDELLATSLADDHRLRARLADQGRVNLALDGLQPDVGHEVLWVLRDCLSGEVLLAKSLLSATQEDLAVLLRQVAESVGLPIVAQRHRPELLRRPRHRVLHPTNNSTQSPDGENRSPSRKKIVGNSKGWGGK